MTERARFRPSVRLRILWWILGLTALAIAGSLLLTRRLLLEQLDAEVNDHLEQEVEEIRSLATGHDPATGQPFGTDVDANFDTFLRRNVRAEGEEYFTYANGRWRATKAEVPLHELPEAGGRWARLDDSAQGELSTDVGPVRWLALPLQNTDGETLGVFVVANFLQGERDEIDGLIATSSAVAGAIMTVAVVVGWVVAGRILRPIREVTLTARAIGDTDLSRRIEVEGRRRDRRAGRHLQRHARPAGVGVRHPAAVPRRRRPRAAHPDHGGERPPGAAGRRPRRAPRHDRPGHRRARPDEPHRQRPAAAGQARPPRPPAPEEIAVEPFTAELFAKARTLDRTGRGPGPDPGPDGTGDGPEGFGNVTGAAGPGGARRWHLDGAAEVTVVADPQRLTQAVMNLARNAVEHAGPGASITMGSATRNGDVEFWVADDGAGIADDQRSTIFDRFSRGGDRLRRSDGAGLGLAIVKAVAEAHAGSVALESRPREGARFTVSIPRQPQETPA